MMMMNDAILIRPGDFVADALGHPDAAKLVAKGCKAIALYWKSTDEAEIAYYHSHGIAVFLIHEWRSDDADGGAALGATYARQAAAAAAKLKYPMWAPMIACADKDTTGANLAANAAYMRAFKANYPGATGMYGDKDLIDAVGAEMALNWQASARWWSRVWFLNKWIYPDAALAHFRQYGDLFGLGIDNNTCLRECYAWLPEKYQAQPVMEDDMLTIFTFAEAYAQLIGWQEDGRLMVRFPGPGTGAYLDGLVASGAAVRRTVPIASTHSMSLVGAIPTGDSKRTWTDADFHEVVPVPAGPVVPQFPTHLTAELGAGGKISGVLD